MLCPNLKSYPNLKDFFFFVHIWMGSGGVRILFVFKSETGFLKSWSVLNVDGFLPLHHDMVLHSHAFMEGLLSIFTFGHPKKVYLQVTQCENFIQVSK
jgi:hypothetical protein